VGRIVFNAFISDLLLGSLQATVSRRPSGSWHGHLSSARSVVAGFQGSQTALFKSLGEHLGMETGTYLFVPYDPPVPKTIDVVREIGGLLRRN
jgi:hypothetical protein